MSIFKAIQANLHEKINIRILRDALTALLSMSGPKFRTDSYF